MFSDIFETTPGIYIPVLFKWMTKERLAGIFEELDILTIQDIDFNEKTIAGGYQGYNAFIHVKEWKNNSNANFVRKKLLNNEEVKIVFDSPKFFICKQKDELDDIKDTTTTPSHSQSGEKKPMPLAPSPPQMPQHTPLTYTDESQFKIPPIKKSTKKEGVSQDDGMDYKPSLPSPCPECEEGIDGNQLMHTCIQKLLLENESEESN